MNLHDREEAVNEMKKALTPDKGVAMFRKGDLPGHDFHGNQYSPSSQESARRAADNEHQARLSGVHGKYEQVSAKAADASAKADALTRNINPTKESDAAHREAADLHRQAASMLGRGTNAERSHQLIARDHEAKSTLGQRARDATAFDDNGKEVKVYIPGKND
jgi:hypothetical protein